MALMLAATAFVFALFTSYAPTIESAARRAVYVADGSPLQIERINATGRYATVLARNAMMEGAPDRVPLLLEHFAFGWQALESLDFRCRLDGHDLSPHDKFVLMKGMPKPQSERACGTRGVRDFGPTAQVEAIRKAMGGPLVPSVIVIGDYAFGQWYGGGGGERLYKRAAGRWRFLAGGGGAIGTTDMTTFGVPKADWCPFGIYNAKCPC